MAMPFVICAGAHKENRKKGNGIYYESGRIIITSKAFKTHRED